MTVDPGISALLARAATLRDKRRSAPRDAGDWYKIRNADGGGGDTAEVMLYDEVGGWWGITAQDFVDELRAITAPKIRLRVNSPGGDVFDGLAIYQALLSHPATVEVQIDGLAASAASVIAQAGDTVSIGTSAMIMIHDAWGWAVGNAADLRSSADLLDKISDSIAALYAQRAGNGDVGEWRERMLTETWYTGAEAVDAGLADTVLDAGPRRKGDDGGECDGLMDRKWDLTIFSRAPRPDDSKADTKTTPGRLVATITPADVAAALHEVLDQRAAESPVSPALDLQAEDAGPQAKPDATVGAPDDTTWGALTAGLTDDPWASLTRGLL